MAVTEKSSLIAPLKRETPSAESVLCKTKGEDIPELAYARLTALRLKVEHTLLRSIGVAPWSFSFIPDAFVH